MGAVDFILHGNKKTDKSLVLAPVDEEYEKHLAERMKQLEGATQTETTQPEEVKVDEMSRLILEHCVEWRAGRSTPRWVSYMDTKTRSEYCHYGLSFSANKAAEFGCALVLELTTHCQRVHSVDAIYDSTKDAQSACSQVAVDEGILEFIKFGNGQTEPATIPTLDPLQPPEQVPTSTARGNLNLQNFFEGLPKPFPEPLERGKTAAELNAPALLNAILQLGKGSKRVCQFFSITEEVARVRRELLSYRLLMNCLISPSTYSIRMCASRDRSWHLSDVCCRSSFRKERRSKGSGMFPSTVAGVWNVYAQHSLSTGEQGYGRDEKESDRLDTTYSCVRM